MASKFGPSRGEVWFWLVFSVLGLAMMGFALWYRGIPEGPALFEGVGLAGAFFGGTAVWTWVNLWRR